MWCQNIIKFGLFHGHLFDSKNTLLYAYLLKEVLGLLMSVYQDFCLVNDVKNNVTYIAYRVIVTL